jgi:NADH dehydrogenase/NADH:ubiquinone oxidoreductase subunit G
LREIKEAHGPNSIGVLGSPRLTNEALYSLRKLATDAIGTENYAAQIAFSLKSFFEISAVHSRRIATFVMRKRLS